MNKFALLFSTLLVVIPALIGCTGGMGTGDPASPDSVPGITADTSSDAYPAQTHLWGYYDIHIDIEAETVEVVLNRSIMFTVNIVRILNKNPATLSFNFNGQSPGPGYVDLDLDVTIHHPAVGAPQINGYDVRGILIGDGSGKMAYNSDLACPVLGEDQYLLNADGYTRWFNEPEFTQPGLFGYTQGIFAAPGYDGSATLNGYKYFADDISPNEDAWTFLNDHEADNGVFSSGAENTRKYIIRFPIPLPGFMYGYAITANWEGEAPQQHPSNAPEAVGCDVTITDNVYYADEYDNGGDLKLDISLFGWKDLPLSIIIESTVLSSPHVFTSGEMTPVASGDHYATWQVKIPADNVTGIEGNEFWVIAEYDGEDYTCPFGVPNDAGEDTLAALFRYDLFVADEPYPNDPPYYVEQISGNMSFTHLATETYSVVAVDPEGDELLYLWSIFGHGSMITLYWSLGDGEGNVTFNWGTDVGAQVGNSYDMYCTVRDAYHDPVCSDLVVLDCVG